MKPRTRKPIVGVMGSSVEPHDALCAEAAGEIANVDAWLLTGGGGGVMAAIARHYKLVKPDGLVIGVLPCAAPGNSLPPPGYPNQWVDICIQTHLHLSGANGGEPLSRNHINVLSATAIIALPGGPGTVSEVCLAHKYNKPVIVFHKGCHPLAGVPDNVPQITAVSALTAFLQQHIHRLVGQ